VGLFANRNHQAVFLAAMFPVLACYSSSGRRDRLDPRLRIILASAVGIFIIPLIFVTGSRAGIFAMVAGLFSVPLVYDFSSRRRRQILPSSRGFLWLVAGIIIMGLALVTFHLGRAIAVDRLTHQGAGEELRFKAWGPMIDIAGHYFPIGSGIGTFREVYRVHEPYILLDSTTFGHAHNEPIELLVTGGIAALLLLCVALGAYGRSIIGWWRARIGPRSGRDLIGTGLWATFILLGASLTDYPLRTPALSCLFCIFSVWVSSEAEMTDTE